MTKYSGRAEVIIFEVDKSQYTAHSYNGGAGKVMRFDHPFQRGVIVQAASIGGEPGSVEAGLRLGDPVSSTPILDFRLFDGFVEAPLGDPNDWSDNAFAIVTIAGLKAK